MSSLSIGYGCSFEFVRDLLLLMSNTNGLPSFGVIGRSLDCVRDLFFACCFVDADDFGLSSRSISASVCNVATPCSLTFFRSPEAALAFCDLPGYDGLGSTASSSLDEVLEEANLERLAYRCIICSSSCSCETSVSLCRLRGLSIFDGLVLELVLDLTDLESTTDCLKVAPSSFAGARLKGSSSSITTADRCSKAEYKSSSGIGRSFGRSLDEVRDFTAFDTTCSCAISVSLCRLLGLSSFEDLVPEVVLDLAGLESATDCLKIASSSSTLESVMIISFSVVPVSSNLEEARLGTLSWVTSRVFGLSFEAVLDLFFRVSLDSVSLTASVNADSFGLSLDAVLDFLPFRVATSSIISEYSISLTSCPEEFLVSRFVSISFVSSS